MSLDMMNKGDKEWAFCILSDAQEHLTEPFFDVKKANDLINKAKRVLDGRYKSDGFTIEVEEPKRKVIEIKIKPAVYSRKSTPPQDREYNIIGGNGAVGNLSEIREFVFSTYGNKAIIVGETLEGEKIREEFQ